MELIPVKDKTPAELFTDGGLDGLLHLVEQEATAIVADISTAKGRKAVASAAMKVAKTKTYLDGIGKDYVGEIKAKTKVIDAERKKARDFLDDLKARVRAPLTEWEQAEKDRIAALEERLSVFEVVLPEVCTSAEVRRVMDTIEAVAIDETWEDLKEKADILKGAALYKLGKLCADLVSKEKAAAKVAAEKAAAERKAREEREARIAAEAAAEATRAAEVEAARVAAESQRKEQEARAQAERERVEREEAKAREEQRQREEIAAREQQIKDAQEATRQAEARAKQQAEDAARQERDRIAAEQKAEQDAIAKRESNRAHRAKIHNDALASLVFAGLTEDQGKIVVRAIATGNIQHCSIQY